MNAWRLVTNLSNVKQGPKIMLSLRDEAYRVTEHLSLDPDDAEGIAAEGGVARLMDVLRDAFSESGEAVTLSALEHLLFATRRERGENMKTWMAKANYAFRKAEARGAALPPVYIAFLILRRSGLSRDDRRSVLVANGGQLEPAGIANTLKRLYPDEELKEYDRTHHRAFAATGGGDGDESNDDEDDDDDEEGNVVVEAYDYLVRGAEQPGGPEALQQYETCCAAMQETEESYLAFREAKRRSRMIENARGF